MKKFMILMFVFLSMSKSYAQSVGIGTTTPNTSSMLDVSATDKGMLVPRMTTVQRTAITSPAKGLLVFDNDVSSFFFYNGTAWTQLSAGSSTNFWSANGSDISNTNGGKVGIGTAAPLSALGVQTPTGNYGFTHTDGTVTIGSYVNANFGWFGTRSNHPLTFFTADGGPQMTLLQNGNFGIGTITPQAKLHVAGNIKVDAANTIELGAGVTGKESNAGKIGYETYTPDALDIIGAGTLGSNRKITFWNEGSAQFRGNVGIGVANANNKLQIGSVGSTGFSGNDIVVGNGTNATGLFQTNSFLQMVSSTDIVLFPRNNGAGRVGINTSTPRAALEVDGNATVAIPGNGYGGYAFYAIGYGSDGKPATNTGGIYTATDGLVSIYASDRVFAAEFNAFSDARIKAITGVSDNWKDLQTLNALRITDYTMKDKVKYGNKSFKKVIAQEVEKVYPQVVSKHTDFVPNVYQSASKIEKTSTGYILHFDHEHKISSTAKKLQLLLSGKNQMQQCNIVAIPNDKDVIIETTDLNADKIFVYGEEVNDFRTVDYEGLTTLNISATQELSKIIAMQNKKIEAMEQEIKLLQSKRD
ncbi:tail fiber domain-containing protein [Ginsengibacter hankyongi]|uniref:Tail fiber domain-containing protein n=1 Tax=Ginsengibacter hankyongi TaxID=2607284 RepID=A0A5J5IB36_9BACT|nr:tail fiber domain-containing protein [Ginsengibacter hankyongi]KAA9035490.1 tail fiber domain-containing protein [Ginsengibacter hankyongi]